MADIHFATYDTEDVLTSTITTVEKAVGEPLYPGDERRYFLEGESLIHTQLYNAIDDAGRQSLLAYARDQVLDAMGERLGVARLEPTAATCTMRFSVQEPRESATLIPIYTRVKAEDEVYFATTETVEIPAGAYSIEVEAESIGKGSAYNGYTEGCIVDLVDLIPYVHKVENLTETAGGDDGEPYTDEGDEHFRERIKLAPNKLSVAGPKGAYEYWIKTADVGGDIIDVKAFSDYETVKTNLGPVNGKLYIGGSHLLEGSLTVDGGTDYSIQEKDDLWVVTLGSSFDDPDTVYVEYQRTLESHVKIVPLLAGGELPDDDTKQRILDVVNADDVRPLTDLVEVIDPRPVPYTIEVSYVVQTENAADVIEAIEGTDGAIAQYIEWQSSKLGRDINPTALQNFISSTKGFWEKNKADGAVLIEITSPTAQELDDTEVAQLSGKPVVTHTIKSGVL